MELPDPTTGVLLTFCAIQVTADAVSRVIHLPNGGNDRMNKLQARIGGSAPQERRCWKTTARCPFDHVVQR
jgi:hypothetical protein